VRHLKKKEQKNEKEQATEDIADRHRKVSYTRDGNAKGCSVFSIQRK
jgi:hypothetical protein